MALVAFGFAAYFFLKGIWLLLKAVYYLWLANDRQLDEAMKSEVFAKDQDYKNFEKGFDKNIDSILNK